MYRQFNKQQFHVLPTQCIYVDLRTNSGYFCTQHSLTGFYKWDGLCLLWGTDSIYILRINLILYMANEQQQCSHFPNRIFPRFDPSSRVIFFEEVTRVVFQRKWWSTTFLYAVLKIQRIRQDLQQGENQCCTFNVQIGTWRQVQISEWVCRYLRDYKPILAAVQISEWVCRYLRGYKPILAAVQISEWVCRYLRDYKPILAAVQISEWVCRYLRDYKPILATVQISEWVCRYLRGYKSILAAVQISERVCRYLRCI